MSHRMPRPFPAVLSLSLPLMLFLLLLLPALSFGGTLNEVEPNDSLATAQNIDSGNWTLDDDPDIGDVAGNNTSTTYPHVTIVGTGNNTYDWYQFTVANAGDVGIFDIDYGMYDVDTYIWLYNSAGSEIAQNDDYGPAACVIV